MSMRREPGQFWGRTTVRSREIESWCATGVWLSSSFEHRRRSTRPHLSGYGPTMSANLLRQLRELEVEEVCKLLPYGCSVLELGGGNGTQAHVLATRGFSVSSIDIADRPRRGSQAFPVADYDGRTVPFANGTFDAVFTSNVLEHIPHVNVTLTELRRVLRPEGAAIHILPTPAWRLWTTLVHYPWLVQRAFTRNDSQEEQPETPSKARSPSLVAPSRSRVLVNALRLGFEPHGEYANALTELYHFGRAPWEKTFRDAGFEVVSYSTAGVFYTGQMLFPSLSLGTRRRLAKVLGSACQVFVTRPAASFTSASQH